MTSTSLFALSTAAATFVVVALLLIIAAVMTAVSVWLIRRTRRDVPALGPLEVMGDRSWRHGDAQRREAILAGARPAGAAGPAPMLEWTAPDQPGPAAGEPAADEPDAAPSVVATGSAGEDIEVEVLHRYHRSDG